MGFARRVVRKSVRKATPRPVRQAMHPARTVKNVVTPRPVKQISRAAYTVRNPLGAAENKVIGAALNAGSGRRRKRRSGTGTFWGSFGRRRGRRSAAAHAVSAKRPEWPQNAVPPRPMPLAPRQAAPVSPAAHISSWMDGPGGTAFRAIQTDMRDISSLSRQAAVDPAEEQLRLKLRHACGRLASDVAAAMTAPPMPDAQTQYWWARSLADFQKAAADIRVGTETRNAAMIRRGGAGLQAAANDSAEVMKRFNAIRDAIR